MAHTSNGFLDNLLSGLLGPKGTVGDWQHASRLYVDNDLRFAPKQKFLYHVYFELDPVVRSILPELKDKHNLEIGMLVKAADLPRYTAIVETRNKYNRKKNIQTGIQYEPISITFHDDNFGVTTALLEAYYRYYFADASYGRNPGAYNKAGAGDNTYQGSGRNQFKYGLDNAISVPFFKKIEISQLAKKNYTTYTIVNPIITQWQHDSVDNSDGSGMMQNTITVAYEAVHYSRGTVNTSSSNSSPKGFGDPSHYDTQPSPISLLGGGTLGIDGIFGAGADLYDFISKGSNFNSPLEAGFAGFQLIRNISELSRAGVAEELRGIAGDILSDVSRSSSNITSGLTDTVLPKTVGPGGSNDSKATVASVSPNLVTAPNSENTQRQQLLENPIQLEDSARNLFLNDFLNDGGSNGVNGANAAWNALPDGSKQLYRNKVLDTTT